MRPTRDELRGAGRLVRKAFDEWARDRSSLLAAAMAFNAVLAAAPFLAGIVAVAALLLGEGHGRDYFLPALLGWIGPHGTAILEILLKNVQNLEARQITSLGLVWALALLLGSVGLFLRVEEALQAIWGLHRRPPGFLVHLKRVLRAIVYAGMSALILVAGLGAAALVLRLTGLPPGERPTGARVVFGVGPVVFLSLSAVATLIFKCLPPVHLTLRQVLPWGLFVAGLHLLGRLVLNLVLAHQAPSSFSQIASLILLYFWLYYAAMVFLFGAELMRVYLETQGVQPYHETESRDHPGR